MSSRSLERARPAATGFDDLSPVPLYYRLASVLREKLVSGEYAVGGSTFGEGWSHFEMGQALFRLGRTDQAATSLNRGLRLLYESGDESAVVLFVIMIAAVALAQGNRDRAYRLAGSAWALRDRSGLDIISIPENTTVGLERATLEALTGADGEAYRQGFLLSTHQAVALALNL